MGGGKDDSPREKEDRGTPNPSPTPVETAASQGRWMTAPVSTPSSGSTFSTLGRGSNFVPTPLGFSGNTTTSTGRVGCNFIWNGQGAHFISTWWCGRKNTARSSGDMDRGPPPAADPEMITLTARQLDSLLTMAVEDALTARGIPYEPPRADKEVSPNEIKPPSRVDTAPAPLAGVRDLNAFTIAPEAQDIEESTDNAPPAVVTDQLEAFKKEIEDMHKQIHDRAALEVPTTSLEVKINALTNELRDGDLFSSLAKKHVATFDDDLLRREEKYITLEEVRKTKKVESKPLASEKRKPLSLSLLILNLQGGDFIGRLRNAHQ
ncbi:hypothetical protein ACS0TY_020373 [Phlomoides rotata]